jgi:hypothetical protein
MSKKISDTLTWDDVDRYTTKEEQAKALEVRKLLIVPFAIISLRKEQEQLGYGIGTLSKGESRAFSIALAEKHSPNFYHPRSRQVSYEYKLELEARKLKLKEAAASA